MAAAAAAAATVRPLPPSPAMPVGARDRMFYGGMALALASTVVVGFSRTYYLRLLGEGPKVTVSGRPITTLIHLHAALFTSWVVLFLVQTALVSSHRVSVHRRLGVAGAVLAAAMVVVGTTTGIVTAARGGTVPGVPPLAFLTVPIFDMMLFATFVTTALVKRRDKESHKRLMLLAYITLMVAAVARLPPVQPLGLVGFFGLAYLFILVGVVYDLASRGRVHKVYLWGGPLLVVSVPLRIAVSGTAAWTAFAEFLTR